MASQIKKSEISNYLSTLITEKGQNVEDFLNLDGNFGLSYQHLIDFIDINLSYKEQMDIKDKLVKIDFHNGDVFHFLDYLIQGMIKAAGLDVYV